MEQRNESFQYIYSAKRQKEVEKIRQRYLPPEENKMEQLRRLDKSAKNRGSTVAIAVGVVGTLVLGLGMCCIMVWKNLFIPGIFIGIVGVAGVALAHPLYTGMTRKRRHQIAPEILRLSDELMRQ